jgi:hypothetical protein
MAAARIDAAELEMLWRAANDPGSAAAAAAAADAAGRVPRGHAAAANPIALGGDRQQQQQQQQLATTVAPQGNAFITPQQLPMLGFTPESLDWAWMTGRVSAARDHERADTE